VYPLPTLKEFLDNPMGKGSMAIPNRQMIKDDLSKRYDKLKKKKKFEINVYKAQDEYYFHILVPSESERDNTYDVVLYFTYDENNEYKYDNFLNRYFIKFFSNCPSFTYTFAYVFNQYGFLVEGLRGKYKDEVIDQGPIVRNPGEIVSFEKSIYFACLAIQESFILRNKMYLNQMGKDLIDETFYKSIRNMDEIALEIKKADNELKKKKETELHAEMKNKDSVVKKALSKGKEKLFGRKGINVITPKKKLTAGRSTIKKIVPK
jgi:hypothetical protein